MSRGAIALAVAALALGLLVGTALDRSPSVPMPVTDGSTESTPAAAGVAPDSPKAESAAADATGEPGAASGPNVATARFTTPLPPEDTPLVSALPTLQAAAEAGSIEAIRRLLRDVQRCARYLEARELVDSRLHVEQDLLDMAAEKAPRVQGAVKKQLESGGLVDPADAKVAALAGPERVLCEGLSGSLEHLRFEAQWRAALAGELEGLVRFVVDPALDVGRLFEPGGINRAERYRESALRFLQQALEQGSPQAAAHLMYAHDPGWRRSMFDSMGQSGPRNFMSYILDRNPRPYFHQLSGQDASSAWRYASLCERVCPDTVQAYARAALDRLRPDLDAETRARAEEEAARLREAHFAGVREVPWFPDLNDLPAPGGPPSGP